MNVAIITYALNIGGIENVIFTMAKSFQKNGWSVTIVETLREGVWKNYFIDNLIPVHTINVDILFSKKSHSAKILSFIKNFDVIFLHDAPYAQAVINHLPSSNLVFPILHSDLESMQNNAVGNFSYLNKIISVSPLVQNKLVEKFPKLDKEKLMVILNGVPISSKPYYKKFNRDNSGFSFIFIGRIDQKQKGILLIPEIISRIKNILPVERVSIYGNGPSKIELEKKIKNLNLDNVIHLHEAIPHEEVMKEFEHHDFLLMPSFFEGHPIVLMEAMVCMTIPFVTNLPGCTDVVVKDGINGFLCKNGNAEDFAMKIIGCVKQGNFLELAENARNTIIENYSDVSMGNKYIDLINNELAKGIQIERNGKMDVEILGDFPSLPVFLIRPYRKILKLLGLYKRN